MNGPEDLSLYGRGDQERISRPAHYFRAWGAWAVIVSLPGMLTFNVAPSVSAVLFGLAAGMVAFGYFRKIQSRLDHTGHSPVFRNAVARPVAYPTLLSESSYWETHSPKLQNTPTWCGNGGARLGHGSGGIGLLRAV